MNEFCNNNDFSLLRLLPTVTRARDFRLYTKAGRLVDLWQNNGAAVLGHTPPSLLKELKNTASRGLFAPFPHFLETRYHKALSRIFPNRTFLLFAAPPPGLETLIADGTAALWRPFTDPAAPLKVPEDIPVLIPVVPGIQTWRGSLPLGLCVLAVKEDINITPNTSHSGTEARRTQQEINYKELSMKIEAQSENQTPPTVPPCRCARSFEKDSDILPPVLLAVAARGIYDLLAAASTRANLNYPRIAKALKSGESFWRREGIYLTPKHPPSQTEWDALFRRFLENGFLLPPAPSQPLILPGVLSPGEEAKLAGLLA